MKDLVDVVERRADLQFKVCLTDEVRVHIVGKLSRDVERTSRLNRLRESVTLLPRHAKTQSFELVCGIHRILDDCRTISSKGLRDAVSALRPRLTKRPECRSQQHHIFQQELTGNL